ncbi:MAG: magnesium transporter [Chloroflexota bacterium]|nr:magnesium transporter [Dehalococcoidia bacterium]MDW8253640.1 magnesium transporter [Chloroflexota bacterium]
MAALRALPREELAEDLLSRSPSELAELLSRLGDDALAEIVAELDPADAARLLGKLSRAQAAALLEEMDPDDAVDIAGELEDDDAEAIFIEMNPHDVEELRRLMNYPPDSAGGIMTTDYVAISPDLTADEALVALRAVAEEAETIYYIYVTDPATNRLLGVLSLRNLVLTRPETPVRDLMVTEIVKTRVDADQEEAVRLLDRYGLLALPVVDEEDRLVGIITADDAASVLMEEAGEDIERLGGSQPLEEPYLRASILHLVRKRLPWLLILFVGGAYTGTVIAAFEETISQVVALTFFIPMLIGTGGNAGSQIVTTLVRALGMGEVNLGHLGRVLWREVRVAALLGTAMGIATYIRAWTLGVGVEIGPVVALSTVTIVLWAAIVSSLLPLLISRTRIDPAVVSTPFITTLVDGTGLLIYFVIASRLLGI